jgi:hypothetical protein
MPAGRAGSRVADPVLDDGGLMSWAQRSGCRARSPVRGGLRFAFYGARLDGGLAGPGVVAGPAA